MQSWTVQPLKTFSCLSELRVLNINCLLISEVQSSTWAYSNDVTAVPKFHFTNLGNPNAKALYRCRYNCIISCVVLKISSCVVVAQW